ncbi:MAG: HAD family phosphatase [Firmicutes bacterium]|nr:HAD family phosphatase [Bacillota bacterium]
MEIGDILKNKKLVLFDFDGTLTETAHPHPQIIKKLLKNFRIEISLSEVKREFERLPAEMSDLEKIYVTAREIFAKNGLKFDLTETNKEEIWKAAEDVYCEELNLRKNASEFIAKLRATGKTITIVTNSFDRLMQAFKHSDQIKNFDKVINHVVTRNDVKNPKPNPEIYQHTVGCYKDILRNEIIVFEDSTEGIRAALDAGLDVIQVESGEIENDKVFAGTGRAKVVGKIKGFDELI